MSFWCHRFDQKTNENIVRISALKVFIASLGFLGSFMGLSVGFLIDDIMYLLSPQEAQKSFQEAPRKLQKISGQKSLQYFSCYFGRNDDTKKTFRN